MKIAAIQIRGTIGVPKKLKDSLRLLRLYKKNTCIIIDDTPSYVGMIKMLKDYITWGEIDNDTIRLLLEKRGRLPGNKPVTEAYLKAKTKLSFDDFVKAFVEGKKRLKDVPGLKPFFRLKPPEKGFERGGVKRAFSLGGVLGYRKDKINGLIKRMV